jgi:uncharacterized protein YukE
VGQTWNGNVGHDLGNVASDIGSWFSGPPGDPARIRRCASQVDSLRDRLDGDRRALNESVDELTTTWTGAGATAFHAGWYGGGAGRAPAAVLESARHSLDQFARGLYDYADQLQHAQEEHWISTGIMAALTIVNAVQLGADPATDAAEVGVATATVAGTSFALADIGTMAIEGAAFGFSSNVVSQFGADLLDQLTPEFDRTGDHAVSLFDCKQLATSTFDLAVSFGVAGAAGALAGRFGGELLSTLLEHPLSRPVTTATFAAATDTAGQLITTGHVDPGEVLVSAGSAALVSAFEPWAKTTTPPAPARQPGPPDNPTAYSVGYEMTLDPRDFGRSRAVHFNRANLALDQAFKNDPSFQAQMEQAMPGAGTAVSGTGGRDEPAGWTWHHAPTSVAGGRAGVMQLVPTVQHTPGTPFYRLMHPDGFGGYAEWAIPAGAPPNR